LPHRADIAGPRAAYGGAHPECGIRPALTASSAAKEGLAAMASAARTAP